jgi:hypothetical protein
MKAAAQFAPSPNYRSQEERTATPTCCLWTCAPITDDGRVRVVLDAPPSQLLSSTTSTSQSFIGGEEKDAGRERKVQHSEWRVSIHAPCRKVVLLLALCSLADSRRSAPAQRVRCSGNVVNTTAQGQQRNTPMRCANCSAASYGSQEATNEGLF